jgi:Bacterial extracellular solute-binding protein
VKTVAAIVAAVVMVVAAVAIRARIDDARNTDGDARLVCAGELAQACTELDDAVGGLDVTIESAGVTALRLSELPDSELEDPPLDGWLVPGPWPEMVDILRAERSLRPMFEESPTTVARSPLVIAVRDERARVLEEGPCAGTVGWRCLGDVAGSPWDDVGGDFPGEVKVGHTDPTTSAEGLLVLAQATRDFVGRVEYDLSDLETPEFQSWANRLVGSTPPSAAPFEEMLSAFPTAVYDAAGATEANAGTELAGASRDRRDAFTLLYPDPVATADVVLGLTNSKTRDEDIVDLAAGGRARQELAEDGWRVEGQPLADGLRKQLDLPDGTNLPSDPGVYIALQRQVT